MHGQLYLSERANSDVFNEPKFTDAVKISFACDFYLHRFYNPNIFNFSIDFSIEIQIFLLFCPTLAHRKGR